MTTVLADRCFLATYRPLCRTATGRNAVKQFALPPYIDGSCRREPDLQSEYPTISALCRARMFAPRLRVGDRVAYITKIGRYGHHQDRHWRLTALLRVERRFDSHDDAADWYRAKGLPLPRNCMVSGNPPVPLDQTDGRLSAEIRARTTGMNPEQIIRVWDRTYFERAKKHAMMLACTILFRELEEPPPVFQSDWEEWVGRVPTTQTPPRISEELWFRLENCSR